MGAILTKLRHDYFLLNISVIQVLLVLSIILDIAVMRQVLGFLYLTFIPGLVLVRALRFEGLEIIELVPFSAGLSLSLLMFTGLLMNQVGPLVGVLKPLSSTPLLIVISVIVLSLSFLDVLRESSNDHSLFSQKKITISIYDVLLVVPPIFSVLGTLLVNTVPTDNYLLLVMLVAISLLIFLTFFYKKYESKYPQLLFMVSLALLLHQTLISNHINGIADIHLEHFLLKTTADNGYWSPTTPYKDLDVLDYNSMLSITILPTIYLKLLDLSGTWILKIVFPILFAFVPMGLYLLYEKHVDRKIAFLATFFFIAYSAFYGALLGIAKLMVSEVFFILLLLVLFNNRMSSFNRSICFTVFSVALIVSHYTMAYFFTVLLLFTMVAQYITKNKRMNLSFMITNIVLFVIIQFVWYIYASPSSAPYVKLNYYITYVIRGFENLVFGGISEAIPEYVVLPPQGIWPLMSRIVSYASLVFIGIGFLESFVRYLRKTLTLNFEFFMMASFNAIILVLSVVLPYFAQGVDMTRFYHYQLIFLSPFCVLGCMLFLNVIQNPRTKFVLIPLFLVIFILFYFEIFEIFFPGGPPLWLVTINKYRDLLLLCPFFVVGLEGLLNFRRNPKTKHVLILLFLVSYFLFQTNFVYEVTGNESWSIPLSKYRMDPIRRRETKLLDERDVLGAPWISRYVDYENRMFCDAPAYHLVLGGGYGMINREVLQMMNNETALPTESSSFIYLGSINTESGIIFGKRFEWNVTDLAFNISDGSKIYSNSGSMIYNNL